MQAGRAKAKQQGYDAVTQRAPVPSESRRRPGLVQIRRAGAKAGLMALAPEHRRQMIAIAAYYKAQRRGFAPGGELQDWLDAEQEVELLFR